MNFFLIIFVYVLALDLFVVCNETEEAITIFYNSVIDHNNLDLHKAQNALDKLNHNDISLFFDGNTTPLLHHFLNLYRLTSKSYEKKKIIEIIIKCVNLGFDSHSTYRSDPPLLFKSILVKELNLTKHIIESNPLSLYRMVQHQKSWLYQFLTIMYSIPSESLVPLAKLLLHVDTIIVGKTRNRISVEEIKILVESADLGKPTVKPVDLALYSESYNRILSTSLGTGAPIKLVDLVHSLDEVVAGSVHQEILAALLHTRYDGLEIILSYIETLTALVITNNGIISNIELQSTMSRNSLHYLCISGASIMLHQLTNFLKIVLEESIESPERELIINMLRNALSSKDIRGHTPISYAIMRFTKQSIIFEELELLCDLLVLDIEVVQLLTPPSQSPIQYQQKKEEDINEDKKMQNNPHKPSSSSGGWDSTRVEIDSSHYPCDILEIHDSTKKLPSNKEFFVKYVNKGVPVIFRQVASSSSSAKLLSIPNDRGNNNNKRKTSKKSSDTMEEVREVFEKSHFLSHYGKYEVPVSTIPYSGMKTDTTNILLTNVLDDMIPILWLQPTSNILLNTFGIRSSISTLAEVANSKQIISKFAAITSNGEISIDKETSPSLPLYTFTTPSHEWSTQLLEDLSIPSSITRQHHSTTSSDNANDDDSGIGTIDSKYSSWSFEIQFYLGSSGTGAPIHFHGHALNTLAYGEKEWVLFPPKHAFYSTIPAIKYFQNASNFNGNNDFRPLRCVQKAGDIMYVPALWGHGTLNTVQSIGVAHEFSVEAFCME